MKFRPALEQDYSQILAIYNQVIDLRTVTADLHPATLASRKDWFSFHTNNHQHPLWVCEKDGNLIAWLSLSPFYGREAYNGCAEVSFYVDNQYHRQGIGKSCLKFALSEMKKRNLHTLLAFVFGNNQASLSLLQKMGFQSCGVLPQVANMQSHHEDLVILAYQIPKIDAAV